MSVIQNGHTKRIISWSITRVIQNGHKGDSHSAGIQMVVVSFLFCKVLDHLIMTVIVFEEKIKSPLHNCLVG